MSMSDSKKKHTDTEHAALIDKIYGKQVVTPALERDRNTNPDMDWMYCWLKRQLDWLRQNGVMYGNDRNTISWLMEVRAKEVKEHK